MSRLRFECHRLLVDHAGLDGGEVISCEPAIPGYPGVGDVAVETRADLEGARPVLGHKRRLEGRQVRVVHGDESPLRQARDPAGVVADPGVPREDSSAEVELVVALE